MDYIYINATVIRADGQKHTQQDLDDFSAFWEEHYNPGKYNGDMPCFSPHEKEIWADYNNYARFESGDVLEFAQTHPHLKICICVKGEDDGDNEANYFYHGNLYEEVYEVRYMPEPRLISWPISYKPFKDFRKDKYLPHFFGEMIFYALQDTLQNVDYKTIANDVLNCLGSFSTGNEYRMFSAITGWSVEELMDRAKQAKKDMEESE